MRKLGACPAVVAGHQDGRAEMEARVAHVILDQMAGTPEISASVCRDLVSLR